MTSKKILILITLIVTIAYQKTFSSSNIGKAQSVINTFETAIAAYYHIHLKYPSSEEGLNAILPFLYSNEIPTDPWGNKYQYLYPGRYNRDKFDIFSFGPDGISKTNGNDYDDLNNWRNPNIPLNSIYFLSILILIISILFLIFSFKIKANKKIIKIFILILRLLSIMYIIIFLLIIFYNYFIIF